MPRYIIHHEGRYNLFSTIVNQPLFSESLSLEQLKTLIRESDGERGIQHLENKLEKVHEKGCSSIHVDLQDCVDDYNLETNKDISLKTFIQMFLSK